MMQCFISWLGGLLQPLPVLASGGERLDYWTLSLFMTVNFLLTAGLFGLGVIVIGLFYNRFKPWMQNRSLQRASRRQRFH